jgi:hypothetical protein
MIIGHAMLLPAAVVPIMELLRRKARRVLDWQLVESIGDVNFANGNPDVNVIDLQQFSIQQYQLGGEGAQQSFGGRE